MTEKRTGLSGPGKDGERVCQLA